MKVSLKYLLVLALLSTCYQAIGQDELLITKEMLGKNELLVLDEKDGWMFRPGNDSTWAKKDLNMSGWQKFNPTQLSVKNADQSGRAEGWFRLKIRVDTSLRNFPLYIEKDSWDAAEVYINGRLIQTFGRMGPTLDTYQAYINNGLLPTPVSLKSDSLYVLAIHFLDYTAMIPHRLRSKMHVSNFLYLGGQKFFDERVEKLRTFPVVYAIEITTGSILCLFFWLLVFLNPREKNVRLIAILSTLNTLSMIVMMVDGLSGVTYSQSRFVFSSGLIVLSAYLSYMIRVVSQIFTKNISRELNYFSGAIFLFGVLNALVIFHISAMLLVGILSFVTSLSITIKYWKTLRGSQWTFVGGIVSFGFFLTLVVLLNFLDQIGMIYFSVLYINIGFLLIWLSLPISMLIYVCIRYREIINEVTDNARQVVQIAEEKRILLSRQNSILEEEVTRRTSELREAKEDVERSLDELKSTQAQLIQSEKMASLGELTAGIAHEIQNPLNFVNNYSEVNVELINDISVELDQGDVDEARLLLSDLKDNETKIHYHGKRADAIVRSMMQHSRTSNGTREPTNLNALADEYLRLAYQSMKAKNSDFEAEFSTDFDQTLPMVEVVQQDMGRVLLNIINNAFQAVQERRLSAIEVYQPEVKVVTRKLEDSVEIKIEDNGPGIPATIKDKIFQPFFTTKPTGQGTGLGLSLAYDIVKAHGGDLYFETREGPGTEFVIRLNS